VLVGGVVKTLRRGAAGDALAVENQGFGIGRARLGGNSGPYVCHAQPRSVRRPSGGYANRVRILLLPVGPARWMHLVLRGAASISGRTLRVRLGCALASMCWGAALHPNGRS